MATRAIVTSQPDVACDVCGRRLLRGERPETFLAGMEPRTVCELCAPRAAYEGWVREAEAAGSLTMRPSRRRRRGVSLLGRLRQLREPASRYTGEEAELDLETDISDEALDELVQNSGWDDEPLRSEVVQRELAQRHPAYGTRQASGEFSSREDAPGESSSAGPATAGSPSVRPTSARPTSAGLPSAGPPSAGPTPRLLADMTSAVDAFNAGEHPRRIAGVARSLGAPTVAVRPVDGAARRYTIVVAWELCWYRYEVDLDDPGAGACLLEKGMELNELPAEDRAANAAADEHGELALAA